MAIMGRQERPAAISSNNGDKRCNYCGGCKTCGLASSVSYNLLDRSRQMDSRPGEVANSVGYIQRLIDGPLTDDPRRSRCLEQPQLGEAVWRVMQVRGITEAVLGKLPAGLRERLQIFKPTEDTSTK